LIESERHNRKQEAANLQKLKSIQMNLLKQLSLKSKCKTRDLQNIEENHWTIKMRIKERLLWPEKKDTINENTKMLRNNRKDTKIF